MSARIPPEAFDFYLSLGHERSYQALAKKYGVSKQAVTKRALRERWQQRLDDIEARARAKTDQRAVETREEINDYYMKIWKVVEKRALEALRNHPLTSALEGVKALDLANKNIRLIRGEPTERTENIETIIRRQYDRWLKVTDNDGAEKENG